MPNSNARKPENDLPEMFTFAQAQARSVSLGEGGFRWRSSFLPQLWMVNWEVL